MRAKKIPRRVHACAQETFKFTRLLQIVVCTHIVYMYMAQTFVYIFVRSFIFIYLFVYAHASLSVEYISR